MGSKSNVSVESDAPKSRHPGSQPGWSGFPPVRERVAHLGIAVNLRDGRLWATVNERDDLGDDVPQDFFTHVIDGGFYGWPYSISVRIATTACPIGRI